MQHPSLGQWARFLPIALQKPRFLQENQLARPMVLKGFKENAVFMPRAPRPAICRAAQQGTTLGNCCRAALTVGSGSCSLLDPILSKTSHQVNPGSFVAADPVFRAQYFISPFAALQQWRR